MLSPLLASLLLLDRSSASPAAQLPLWSTGVSPRTRTFSPTDYTAVDGFFIQSAPTFNDSDAYDPLSDSFGIIDKSPTRWNRFQDKVDRLNADSHEHAAYKVFFLARHGQGWHNVAETKYGSKAWDEYWSMQYGDDEITWGPDPVLTPLGIAQAQAVNKAWKEQLRDGVPLPQRLYSSPLSRAASTLNITWKDILIDQGEVTPLFVEHMREVMGVHTCALFGTATPLSSDQRSTKTHLEKVFPDFTFDVPFSEHDQLWSPDWQESPQQQALRVQQLLNRIFALDSSQYMSITAHGGFINAFFRVVGHPKVKVSPGGIVPIVVKAVEWVS
ncbi:SPOSA6832_00375 [Sporobolomyces salmonicolor]|uniref:SPOSA6832_00375-mRNA-1:cds n=1 Tax=Sporidiobolus salmonicolor TaxID=5005 RepID=A0A0D6EG22_SPOSA|nr:SPOSA6832_00375 [Sporobolomyces salmonicolor]